jgi:hypothetical protein
MRLLTPLMRALDDARERSRLRAIGLDKRSLAMQRNRDRGALPNRHALSAAARTSARLLALVAIFGADPTLATDGVIEINHAQALAGGVTGGDSAGYPVTIDEGSYRLTSDLDLRDIIPANTHAIEVNVGGFASVSIDLNGFSILGSATCTFSPPCTNAGSGEGIRAATGEPAIQIRNGKVVGMGSYGIYLQNGVAELDRVSVTSNGGPGIYLGYGVVSRTIAYHNGGSGIIIFDGVVRDSFARLNAGYQIQADNGTIDTCSVEGGTGSAIRIGYGVLRGTFVKASVGTALECFSSCALTGNKFTECEGANCFAGSTERLQVPPESNMCGSVVCPDPVP